MAATARRAFLVWVLMTIALLIPIPASAGGGGCGELTDGSRTTVEIEFSCITPTLIRVEPGDTVTFVNRDSYRHVIAGAGYQWASKGYMGAEEAFAATGRIAAAYCNPVADQRGPADYKRHLAGELTTRALRRAAARARGLES